MSFNFHKMFDMFIRFSDPTIAALNTYTLDHKSWVLQLSLHIIN